jgi:hypothetical protein
VLRSSGAGGFQRGNVAAQRGGFRAGSVGSESVAGVAGVCKALGVLLREAVDLVRAASLAQRSLNGFGDGVWAGAIKLVRQRVVIDADGSDGGRPL